LAEELLMPYLTPEQAEDWSLNGAFNVRGSDNLLYRVNGGYAHDALIREDGTGTAVWCQEVSEIPADNALGLLLYLGSNARHVFSSGCHSYAGNYVYNRPTDYDGAI